MMAEFEDDPDLYVLKPVKYVGIEVWQVGFLPQLDCIVGLSNNSNSGTLLILDGRS